MAVAVEFIFRAYQARKEGDLPLARELYAEGARMYREQNDLLAYAHAIRHIADIYRDQGKLAEAKPLYEEALEIYRNNLGTKLLDLANTVRPYALLNQQQGNLEAALEHWKEARQLYASLRLEGGVSECGQHIAALEAGSLSPQAEGTTP